MAEREVVVVYAPKILRSLAEIKEAFGVGERQIKLWVRQGAPIAVEGCGTARRRSGCRCGVRVFLGQNSEYQDQVGTVHRTIGSVYGKSASYAGPIGGVFESHSCCTGR